MKYNDNFQVKQKFRLPCRRAASAREKTLINQSTSHVEYYSQFEWSPQSRSVFRIILCFANHCLLYWHSFYILALLIAFKEVKSNSASGGRTNKRCSIRLKQEILKVECLLVTKPKSIECLSPLSITISMKHRNTKSCWYKLKGWFENQRPQIFKKLEQFLLVWINDIKCYKQYIKCLRSCTVI